MATLRSAALGRPTQPADTTGPGAKGRWTQTRFSPWLASFYHASLIHIFKPQVRAKSDTKPAAVQVGYSNPVLIDWDGSGLLDLLVGDMIGLIDYYPNRGTQVLSPNAAVIAWSLCHPALVSI